MKALTCESIIAFVEKMEGEGASAITIKNMIVCFCQGYRGVDLSDNAIILIDGLKEAAK